MSSLNAKSFTEFFNLQQAELKDLLLGAATAWGAVVEKRQELLQDYEKVENAPEHIQKQIAAMEAEYQSVWGIEGTMMTALKERQAQERMKFIKDKTVERNKRNQDREHER